MWFLHTLAGPSQDHPQPRHHLLEAERLGDVIVCAQSQTGDLVLHAVPGGEKQRRSVDTVRAKPAQHPETVHAGHHHVEDHRIGSHLASQVQGGGATGGGEDLETLELQAHRQQVDDIALVVDHQHSCLGRELRTPLLDCCGHAPNLPQFGHIGSA